MKLAALAVLVLLAVSGVTSSGADFVAVASSPSNSFTAAADFNTVAVTMSDTGTPLRGTATLQATASSDRGIQGVVFQSSPAGAGTWTDACQDAGAPYSCDWSSSGVVDGPRDLRAVATDLAGYTRNSAVVGATMVDNTAPTVSVPPTGPLRGTVSVALSAADGAGSGVKQVAAEFRPAGGGAWTPVCVDTVAPFSCDGLDTTQAPDGLYEARATADDNAGFSTTSSVTTVRIDNTAPAVPTLADPGASLQGTVGLSGTASDSGSGIAAWVVQRRPAGGGAWTDTCSDGAAPYGCSWDTTSVADALYDVRAVARDQAGNEMPSATFANVRVDNNGPAVTLADPGAYLRGTVALSATATDPAGVQSVVFERKLASGGGWTTICTDNAAPYTCSFNTTSVADGSYDLRARATDTLGHTGSATVAARTIDNTAPAAAAVDAGNGGATAGRLEAGDWLQLTWTEPIAPASVLAGWNGSAVAVRVELQNVGSADELNVWNAAGTTRLNLIDAVTDLKLNANFVTTAAWFDATMTRAGAAVTVTLGAKLSGTLTTAATANMTWTPSTLATDLAGNASTAVAVTEPNPKDRDF